MSFPVAYPLILGAILFALGLYGALTQRNAIRILMCVELMLNAVNINLIAFGSTLQAATAGQLFALFVMTVAAAEVALALAIILILARREKHIDIERVNLLRW
ncbi:MAG: NADH-quinone oxidoreductase subunit NuoK [Firmicutes bacterium]|nr:NADH-quinone oxidoreductase subunit NuoK [Bacillota bacterium]